jgi:molybdenum cofactor cytidylyltransferase
MTANRDLKIGGIMLAAGGSTRLGRPKQFLEFEGKTLLRRAAEAMCASVCDPVIAVLGAEYEKAEAEITDLPLAMRRNEEWESGMSSSIKIGLKELLLIEPEIDAVVITLCDQPFVNAEMIDRLGEKFAEAKSQMVAAEYDGVAGVPALFSNDIFDALFRLEGDKGARDLLRDPNASVETIEINEAAIDIDNPDDVDRLKPR